MSKSNDTPRPLPHIDCEVCNAKSNISSGDHDSEIDAFRKAILRTLNKYWFVGRIERIGVLAQCQFEAMAQWRDADNGVKPNDCDGDDDGDDWKKPTHVG